FGRRPARQTAEAQRREYDLIGRLDLLAAAEYPEDQELRARIRSYELAFRMQAAVPEAVNLAAEAPATRRMYGLDHPATRADAGPGAARRRPDRPRPPPQRVHRLAGRGGAEEGVRPRRDRRAGLPRPGGGPLRHRLARHGTAAARPGQPPAGGPRPPPPGD